MSDTQATPVFEEIPCTVCGADNFEVFMEGLTDRVWHRPGVFRIDRCKDCGHKNTRPRPNAASLHIYYDNTYDHDDRAMKQHDLHSFGGPWLHRYRLNNFRKTHTLTADDRVLDVGCSYGGFLREVVTQTPASGWGLDMDPTSISEAFQHERITYQAGLIDDLVPPEGGFTVVSLYETLEHTLDPVGTMRSVHARLAPGGFLIVEVPNVDNAWIKVLGRHWFSLLIPQHLQHFNLKSLDRAAREAGFDIVRYHQTMFIPAELVLSLAIWWMNVAGPAPANPSIPRRLLDFMAAVFFQILFIFIEIPLQIVMRYLGVAGHQFLVVQKDPAAKAPVVADFV